MFKKPNKFQRMFIECFFLKHKHSIVEAQKRELYLVVGLYDHNLYVAAHIDEVDYWITELERKGYKWFVLDNIVFLWGKGVKI